MCKESVKPPPEICPNCGADVPPNARACPECGSDYETGWSDHAEAQRLDLPDDEFNYDEFVKEEFGGEAQRGIRPRGIRWLWWIVAVLLLLAFAWFLVRSGR
jgi:zinc-ribbon domain